MAAKIKADREDPEDGKAGMPMEQDNKPWTNKWLKMILIVAIILVGCPVIVPVAIGLLAAIAGILIAAFAGFLMSLIGFADIIATILPFEGYCGLIFLVAMSSHYFCILKSSAIRPEREKKK